MVKPRVKRKSLKPGQVLCEFCNGNCCRYFALPIDTPETWDDYSHVRWYLMHGDVSVFVEDGTWYLVIHADCKHLMDDNRCSAYETRPGICRKYSTDDCEYDNDAVYDQLFESPEQVWEYAEAVLPPPKRNKVDRPIRLPVLS